ncbi:MAG: HAMP domain-containing sensor histidine kinase [Rhodothermales bacterium]|nr:HAMP domain-containing sensor histidine kinase [Rhodothermales bacterium]
MPLFFHIQRRVAPERRPALGLALSMLLLAGGGNAVSAAAQERPEAVRETPVAVELPALGSMLPEGVAVPPGPQLAAAVSDALPLPFLLGVSLPVLGLLVLLWWLYRDPRYPALAFLLGGVVLEFVVHVNEAATQTQSALIALVLTAGMTGVLVTHYPLLFRLKPMARPLRTSLRYRAAVHRLHPAVRARWPRSLGLLVLTCLAVLALGLAFQPLWTLLALPDTIASGTRALSHHAPALLVLPSGILLWDRFRQARPLAFAGAVVLLSAFGWTAAAAAAAVPEPVLRYPFWGALLVAALVQLISDVSSDAQSAEKDHRRIRGLHHTVRQRAEDLKQLMVQAQAANLAKTQFVSSVSHELRTPLTAISGYAQILLEETPDESEMHREFLGIIRQSCERLQSLINDLLDMAKVESGRVELKVSSVTLQPILKEVTAQLLPLAETKGIQLLRPRLDVDAPVVHADPLRLRQVLINLLSNAIKFTERGCVGIYVAEAVIPGYQGTQHSEAAIAIDVFDTGIGISEAFLEKLFEPFTQEENAYAATQQGTGLGLSITRELIERMGGRISVSSTVGEGTSFRVLLARSTAEQKARRRAPRPPETATPRPPQQSPEPDPLDGTAAVPAE